jgi:hypothetical protein
MLVKLPSNRPPRYWLPSKRFLWNPPSPNPPLSTPNPPPSATLHGSGSGRGAAPGSGKGNANVATARVTSRQIYSFMRSIFLQLKDKLIYFAAVKKALVYFSILKLLAIIPKVLRQSINIINSLPCEYTRTK